MKQLPEDLLQSLEGTRGFERPAFEAVHALGAQVTSIRINPNRTAHGTDDEAAGETIQAPGWALHTPGPASPVPWSRYGYYLQQRPSFTFDPLFHAGMYYVQEASSMFLEQAFRQLLDTAQPMKVLDLCAAPGGKSTHIQSLLSPGSLLVSNEVIKSRTNILTDNLVKWGADNVIVTNNDPAAFRQLEGWFDVLVVDAPCSGSGLFRRDEAAMDEWSPGHVQLCSQRQKRILADALPALKEGGLLVYSTCSYSREEDEEIADWLVQTFGLQPQPLQLEADWNIVETLSPQAGAPGCRFYPDQVKGEGFFLACFRKMTAVHAPRYRPAKIEKATARERAIIAPWLQQQDMELIRDHDIFYALPASLAAHQATLRPLLNIRYQGVALGQIMKEKLVPAHALALSPLASAHLPLIDLPYADAIKYLQRRELSPDVPYRGWQRVGYQGRSLGWINVLANRVNNYYPKELRILKESNDAAFEK